MKHVDVLGGSVQHIAALKAMDLDQPDENWEMYSNWADSIRSFPQVIKKTVNNTATSGYLNPFYVIFIFKRPDKDPPFETHPFHRLSVRQLRPLSELVKEVPCAGMKKVYFRRAIEQYLSESDACHCRPCANNGLAVMDGEESKCICICKPGTSGPACEDGAEAEGQPGVGQSLQQ